MPDAIFEAPEDALIAFLQGLFDADGCVVDQEAKATRYVGLAAGPRDCLSGCRNCSPRSGSAAASTDRREDRQLPLHEEGRLAGDLRVRRPLVDLRITAGALPEFRRLIGFTLPGKQGKLDRIMRSPSFYHVDRTARLVSRESHGFEPTYNLTEPRNHSYVVGGTVVANCSEYVHLDNSSCNLASINLLKFLGHDNKFDVEEFRQITELIITAMDISICFADFPTEK